MPAPVTAPHPEPSETVREPGRALDALIAEKVMGWGWMTSDPAHTQVLPFKRWLVPPDQIGDWGHARPADLSLPMEEPWWLGSEKRFGDCEIVPFYSTDIAAAWLVVEKMHARRVSCIIGTNGCARDQRGVKFYEDWRGLGHSIFDGEPHPGFDAVAATVPLAICLAALAAVESSRA